MTAVSPSPRAQLRYGAPSADALRRRTSPIAVFRLATAAAKTQAGDFAALEVGAAVMLGALSLLMSGIMPLFLGALANEHRLTAAGIGRLATVELLSAAVATGSAGLLLKPRRLKGVAVVASLGLALANLATIGLSGLALTVMRVAAGLPEGVLLWMVVGLIARTRTPDFVSGVLFTTMASLQLVVAVGLALLVMPRFGADGAYAVVAGLSALGLLAAIALPNAYGPPPAGEQGSAPPLRGWLALAAVFVFQAAISGAGVYILPLAHQAGVSDGDGQTAVSVALAMEVVGALAATAIAKRVNFLDVFLIGGAALLAGLGLYAVRTPGWMFIAVSGVVGFFSLLVLPFFVSLTVHADPSRRAAVQIGAAQLLGGALGPVLASLSVGEHDVHAALGVSAILFVLSLSVIFFLNRPAHARTRSVRTPVLGASLR